MPEADRDPQHRVRSRRPSSTPSHSPNVGEPAAQVHDDVEHPAPRDAHELALAGMRLEVDAAQRALTRARMVVLDELGRDAVVARDIGAERLHEEAALVAVHGRREQDEAVESGLKPLHCGRRLGSAPSKDRLAMPRTATMPPAARGHQTLSTYISARFDEFSRSQKDVAQYVVDHLDEVAFHTAEELARRANTSSLHRRALQPGARLRGLPGAAGGGARGVPPPPSHRRVRRSRPRRSSASTSRRSSRPSPPTTSTSRTRRGGCRRSEVDGAIEAIAAAERILIAGTDQMAFFASYLRHLLMLLDVRAEIAASPSQEALSRLGRIDERTLVIGLSAPAARTRSWCAR